MRRVTLGAVIIAVSTAMTAVTANAQAVPAPRITYGVSAGAAIPTGDLANGMNTGYNVSGQLTVHAPFVPLNLRLEASYSKFKAPNSSLGQGFQDASMRSLGFIGNLVYSLPLPSAIIHPYVIGGLGLYNDKPQLTANGVTESVNENELGYNGGAGVEVPLSRFSVFAEARYHHIRVGHKLGGGSISYVPITFGITF
jgi:hypothetical protein